MPKFSGTVQWFNNAKGYGFLSTETGPNITVHVLAIQTNGDKPLEEGGPGNLELKEDDQELEADKVRKPK